VEAYRHVPVINAQRLTSEAHMSDPSWRETRPSRPYGSEPGARPRGRDPAPPPGAPRTPSAGARTPRSDPGSEGGRGGRRGDSPGSDPRGRDPGRDGRDSGPRGAGGNGWDPGRSAGRGGDPPGAPTRRLPAQPGAGRPPRTRPTGAQPTGTQPVGRQPTGTQPVGTQPTGTQPVGTRSAITQPHGVRDGARHGTAGPRVSRGRRNSPPPRGRGRWGSLQGGLGVCIIVASAALGAIVTMVARSAPGFLLGLFVVVGTVTAALAVRPRAGRMLFPVPILSYLVAALTSGVVFDRAADSSRTTLAIAAAQWIANGFFAMGLATVLAVVITTARWYRWRRGRPGTRDRGRPSPTTGPTRSGPARSGRARTGPDRTEEPGDPGPGPGAPGGPRARGDSRARGGPGAPEDPRARGARGGPEVPGGPGVLADPGARGTGPRRPSPRRGSEPYNFSSGA
jgi:hypothetical protein